MSSSNPETGPQSTIQRMLPLVLLGIAVVLVFTVFPQYFGGARPATPTVDATPTVAAVATPHPAVADTSTRTYIWNLVLVNPLEAGLRYLAINAHLGAGVAIILFTICIRLVLLPLTVQQIRSQKAMAQLQPEIKALQKKYPNDKEKVSQETMALYKEYGVNPAAGCLPMVVQMPVLFALYAALRNLALEPDFQTSFLWIARLDQPDIIKLGGVTLPFLLPVLAAITQWVQQRMMTQPTDDPQQRMQGQMMQFMPLMMLWFGLSFSAGLALYWVTQNLVGIVQQYFSTGWGSLFPNREARYGAVFGKKQMVRTAANGVVDGPPAVVEAPRARRSGRDGQNGRIVQDGRDGRDGTARSENGTNGTNGAFSDGAAGATGNASGTKGPAPRGSGGRRSSGRR